MATSAMSVRDARRARTARRLKETARELTAERGLSGFTVEELCERVEVSRRTFFNYFASKENAVIGVPADVDASAAEERFVAADGAVDPLADLMVDLIELHLARWALLDLTAADIAPLVAAFEREPRLLGHVLRLAGEGEEKDIALVRRRTGLPADDPRPATAVQVVAALVKVGVDELFRPGTADDLRLLLHRRLDAARSLLAPGA